jgi:hypothetical protein
MDASDGVTHWVPVLLIPVGRQHPAVAGSHLLGFLGPRSSQQQLGLRGQR